MSHNQNNKNQTKAKSIYQLLEEINLFHEERRQIQKSYGMHRLTNFVHNRDKGKREDIPNHIINFFDNEEDFNEDMMCSLFDIPLDKIDELSDILHTQDIRDFSIAGYCSQSREFLLLQAVQSVAKANSEALDWVIDRKLERAAYLMTVPSLHSKFHMGLFVESVALLDTLTGRNVESEKDHFIFSKIKDHPIITPSCEGIKTFCEETMALITEGSNYEEAYYDSNEFIDYDIETKSLSILPTDYSIKETIYISPLHDPFANIPEQREILFLLNDMIGKMEKASANTSDTAYVDIFDTAYAYLANNIQDADNESDLMNYGGSWPRMIPN